jgi:RimJ/RimL family protein N-acetyltransferase
MRLALGNDEAVGKWLSEKLGVPIHPPFVTMSILDDNDHIHGAMLFNNYNGFNIEVTIYGKGVWNRRFIKATISYAFDQLKVLRLTGRTKRSNKEMCSLFPRLGFEFEFPMKHYFGPSKGDDALIFRMTRDNARKWIGS